MKYLKMLGLAAVAAMALMAFGAGSASASTVICSTTVEKCPAGQTWPVGTVLHFSLRGSAKLVNKVKPTETLDTCTKSTILGELSKNPDANGEPTGPFTKITWENCTFPTTQLIQLGSLKVSRIAGTSNGTVKADGEIRVTIHTVFFGSCVYGVKAGAHLGVLTEGKAAETEAEAGAEFSAENAVAEKLEGSAFACPTEALWTAKYVLTSPTKTTLSVGTE